MQRPYTNIFSSRSVAFGTNGMVATSEPLATSAGINALKEGGTAIDAAIAANAMLGLVEPCSCGVGGDLFAIIWNPKSKKLEAINASGPSSNAIDIDRIANEYKILPQRGGVTVTVPGCVKGWEYLYQKFGKLDLKEIFKPSINYALDGFPVSETIAKQWALESNVLKTYPSFANTYLPNGSPPKAGTIYRNENLAKLYQVISSEGLSTFYNSDISKEIVKSVQKLNGYMTDDDLKRFSPDWIDPVSTKYRDYDVWEIGPNNQGLTVLQMLNILEFFDFHKFDGPSDPRYLHILIEAKRLAFEDRAKYYSDPKFNDLPIEHLISKGYAEDLAKKINPNKVLKIDPHSTDISYGGDTVYLTVADRDGLMVSLIQSNYRGFGSGVIVEKYGFGLQSRGELFSLNKNHANRIDKAKRPFHTIIPGFLTKGNVPLFSFGVMGADMQPQGHTQILVNLIDFGLNIQQCGDMPRVRHEGSSNPKGELSVSYGKSFSEFSLPKESLDYLLKLGHNIEYSNDGLFGGYQSIWRDPDSLVYSGASESRKDGLALGY
jgi:gamma-glutamyltranspeptidase/glutathione hydrolase